MIDNEGKVVKVPVFVEDSFSTYAVNSVWPSVHVYPSFVMGFAKSQDQIDQLFEQIILKYNDRITNIANSFGSSYYTYSVGIN